MANVPRPSCGADDDDFVRDSPHDDDCDYDDDVDDYLLVDVFVGYHTLAVSFGIVVEILARVSSYRIGRWMLGEGDGRDGNIVGCLVNVFSVVSMDVRGTWDDVGK